jgi:hypothetical protein
LDQALSAIQTKAQKFLRKFIRKTGLRATGAGRHGVRAYAGPKPGGSPVRQHLARLRVITVILLLLALAGTVLPLPSRRQQVVILLDVSDSIDRGEQERARRSALRFLAGLSPRDQAAAVAFAAGSGS